jgi:hypothetical protein
MASSEAVMGSARFDTEPAGDSFPESLWAALSTRPAPQSGTHGLPLPRLASQRSGSATYYVVTTIDSRGRLADRSPLRILQWRPGRRVDMSTAHGAVIVLARRTGDDAVTRQGHLRLPVPIRRLSRLNSGDRMLVAAFADRGLLVAYTMPTVNAMILAYHVTHPGGLDR